ncbi:F-box/WD repeat-containing protein 5-like [Teleopsis dalmanni]|uniref:F-box/WD repeat-containing protein 5-like n=1 Tax=Teleopsis dalmanni TaxID=139649 RepID=UPI0018CE4843|nr:F-box/WD repeat-containing protein 5-like [Teleopsis dalmanni]
MTTNTSSTSLQEMDTNPIAEELEQDFLESKWWTIPHHILHSIFYSLPVKDVVSASGVCRRWREIASDELLWKKKMHRHFKIDPTLPLKPGAESWRSEYVRLACEIPFIQTQSIRGHAHQVLHVSFSHDGDMFATCSKDGYVIVKKGITYKLLIYLSKDDIKDAIVNIGLRAEFREKLFKWRKLEVPTSLCFNIDDETISMTSKVHSWLKKSLSTSESFPIQPPHSTNIASIFKN